MSEETTDTQITTVDTYIRSFKRIGDNYVIEFEDDDKLAPMTMRCSDMIAGNILRFRRWCRDHELVVVELSGEKVCAVRCPVEVSAFCDVLDEGDLWLTNMRHHTKGLTKAVITATITTPMARLRRKVIQSYLGQAKSTKGPGA